MTSATQRTDLNFSDVPILRGQITPEDPVDVTSGDLAALNTRVTALESSQLVSADLSESDSTYLYFGFDTDWRIRRVVRATGAADTANNISNGSYANLAAAWPDRATLTYV